MYDRYVLRSKYLSAALGAALRPVFMALLLLCVAAPAMAQLPQVTVRLANPQYDCENEEYCLDVEFQCDQPGREIFGMNVRFFYEDEALEFIDFRNFEGGYGAFNPNPPQVFTSAPAGPVWFNFPGAAEYINGAIQILNTSATPVVMPTTGWTRVFSVCFSVEDPVADPALFCPSVILDLEQDPANGSFFDGSEGIVITLIDQVNNQNSDPAGENVVQYNWEYIGTGSEPYGQPNPTQCISIECEADIALVKTGTFEDENGDGFAQVGETISYAFEVTNTGDVALTDVTVTDPLVTVSGGPLASLAVGASDNTTFTASYTITQADIDNGGVANQALATGTPPTGPDVTDLSDDDSPLEDDETVTPLPQDPSIAIIKTGTFQDENGDGFAQVGETISYAFEVTNTGNVTLTDVTVTDPLVTVSGGPLAALAPGASNSTTFTASYTITQADINTGSVTNQATATGTDPDGMDVTDISDDNSNLEDDETVTPLPQDPSIAIIKIGTFEDENGDGFAQVGETISYAFEVTNTGNVTLTDVTVTDPLVTVSGGPISTLAVGASNSTTFTASYTITQADINTGSVTNQATATGTDPDGMDVTDVSDDNSNLEDDETVTPLPQDPSIAIIKIGTFEDENGDGFAQVGETISYSFAVTNTGNVTLTDVTVTDPLVTVSGGPLAALAPGASNSTTFTASYTITQADINTGSVTNQATATGTDPDGMDVTDVSDDNSNLEDDETVTPLPQDPSIAIIKIGTFEDENGDGFAQVGETISYAFEVTNTGNVTLTNVTVTDPLVTVSGGPLAALAPGASNSTTFTASYTITQADINTGSVTNQATATGTDPDGMDVTDVSDDNSNLEDDETVTPLPQNPSIAIIKTGTFEDENGDGFAQVGETISYAFEVTNTGNVTLTNVTVTDPLVTVSGGPISTLAVGASNSTTFTASYTITQADINSGSVTNQATATGTDPDGMDVTDVSDDNSNLEDDETVTPLPQNPSIAIIKTGTFEDENGDGFAQVGETISYAFEVTNTGNVTLTNVTVTDPLVTVSGGPISTLAVGASNSTTFTASYTITQADINSGSVTNQATATGTDPDGMDVTDVSDDNSNLEDDETVTPLPQEPAIAIIKTGTFQDENGDGFAQAGETISYSFAVTNTGNVTLTNVTVTDPLVTVSGGPINTLAVGASNSTTFTASYTITQADINSGSVTNQATATGTDPDGIDVTDFSDDNSNLEDDETVTPLPQEPAIAIIKTGTFEDENGDGFAQVGETISYAFEVTNTGNVTLTNVTVTDPLVTVSGGPINTLAVGASNSTTFTASYTITQADINTGSVTNQATATGTDPDGMDVTDLSDDNSNLEDDETVTPLPQEPAIAIIKTGTFEDENGDGFAQVGETISYSFTVTNMGNVTLTNVTVTDPLVTVSGGPINTLAVGASNSTTFTASYTITQADINTGSVTNQATATGTDPDGMDVTDLSDDDSNLEDDETVTPLPQEPAIAIIKTGTFEDENGDGFAQVGETISYSFAVTNTGNVTLTNVTVTDPLVTVSGGPINTLAVGASNSTTFTASYTITQADINSGSVTNQATATGTDPDGIDVTDLSDDNSNLEDDETVTPLPQEPAIAIIKTGTFEDENGDGFAQVGETISYSFTVTNTGNVTLTNVTVTDPLVTVSGGPIASLAPGASNSTTFTASYTITQADINSGSVTNQATATGTDPDGMDVTDISDDDSNLEDDETVTPLPQEPAIAIIKTGTFQDESGDGFAQAGETISYSFTVTNTGNVTLTNVTVTDPLVTVSGGPIASLAPGASNSTTFTASYTITQANINSGSVTNQATATGTDPDGMDVTDVSDDNSNLEDQPTVTPLPQEPAIAIIKTGTFQDENGDGIAQAGETISYSFAVTNIGNVTLNNITVTDPLVTVSGGPLASLAPGASNSTTFTASYTITQADINTGSVTNQATATGTDPDGMDVTDVSDNNSNLEDDPTVTPLPQAPAISLTKTASPLTYSAVGNVITYTLTVENTGNVPLTNVAVSDPMLGFSTTISSLAPGASQTFVRTYSIMQAEIDAGSLTNLAMASGTDPDGNTVEDEDTAVVTANQAPEITVVKTASPLIYDAVGDVINYQIVVTNSGNLTLTNVAVTDPLTGLNTTITTLAVGAVQTFNQSYTITQANMDAGSVLNVAMAIGTDPNGNSVEGEDDATVTGIQSPDILVTKTASPQTYSAAGDVIAYTILVENTGDVTLTNVQVTDPLTGLSTTIASLAPGASQMYTEMYTITQGDMNAGSVLNVATAEGEAPNGDPIEDDDDETVTANQMPSIALVKTGTYVDNAPAGVNVGDQIAYTFTVRNTGNVTLTDITITDPLPGIVLSGGPIDLDPGEEDGVSFTGLYTITQDDISNGGVENQALATGTPPIGPDVTDLSDDESFLEDDPTVVELPCVTITAWVYLEGATIDPNGSGAYSVPMRTDLNDLRLLPGQSFSDIFLGTQYTPAGQPYNIAPWLYSGDEGSFFDSNADINFGDADYPSTVVDWVMVSLRSNPNDANEYLCQAAALLHEDGSIEFVEEFTCCGIDRNESYYVVIEHRSHLVVMSANPVAINGDNAVVYDFRTQQSYINDPLGFGAFSGQKEFAPGSYCMYGGNGDQAQSSSSATDITFDDRTFWEGENGDFRKYRAADYNMNGDTNFNDRGVWELNNGTFTSVPRE